MNNTQCNNCGHHQAVPAHYLGRSVKCQNCGGDFVAGAYTPQTHSSKKVFAPSRMTIVVGLVICVIAFGVWLANGQLAKKRRDEAMEERARKSALATEAKAKAEAPFYKSAQAAIEEAHNMKAAVNVGINHQKYGDQLISFAAKVENHARECYSSDVEIFKPGAKEFRERLVAAVAAYKSARGWWELKIKYPNARNEEYDYDEELQKKWTEASQCINDADGWYLKLKNE